MNPILAMLSQSQQPGQGMNNPIQMLQQFSEFKKTMAGKNPQAIVENLLKSGQMSNQQFEQLKQQAKTLSQFLK